MNLKKIFDSSATDEPSRKLYVSLCNTSRDRYRIVVSEPVMQSNGTMKLETVSSHTIKWTGDSESDEHRAFSLVRERYPDADVNWIGEFYDN